MQPIPDVRRTLVHALTEYDAKQARTAKRPGDHNPYALALYLEPIDRVMRDGYSPERLRTSILESYNGRLADILLKAVGQPVRRESELR